MLTVVCAVGMVCASSSAGGSYAAQNPILHVELSRYYASLPSVTVECDQSFSVTDDHGTRLAVEPAGQALCISVVPGKAVSLSASLSIFQEDQESEHVLTTRPGSRIRLAASVLAPIFTIAPVDAPGHGYRGTITITPLSSGAMRVVDEVDLEDYLQGVVKAEIGADAPPEAMKAQAVAARTYAVRNMGRLWQEEADLDDTTRSQGYLGTDGETSSIVSAVSQTAGQVLTYNGTVIDALYSTDCGGMTAPGPPDEPYLKPIRDSDCAKEPGWVLNLTDDELAEALHKSTGLMIGSLRDIAVSSKDASGRAIELTYRSADGSTGAVSAAKLRQIIGPNILRSTLFKVTPTDAGWEFNGQGWGHGVGLCQAGAISRASSKRPESYEQILADYYPDTKLVVLSADLIPRSRFSF